MKKINWKIISWFNKQEGGSQLFVVGMLILYIIMIILFIKLLLI